MFVAIVPAPMLQTCFEEHKVPDQTFRYYNQSESQTLLPCMEHLKHVLSEQFGFWVPGLTLFEDFERWKIRCYFGAVLGGSWGGFWEGFGPC